jgi:hemerythrin superfamily protein
MAAADAVSLIERDHRAMEELFNKVMSGDGDRVALLDEITVRLTAHARAEEQEVYPTIKQADPGEGDEVEHAYDEHHEAEHLLHSARNLTASPHFDEAFAAFVAAVKHHVEEEEQEVLPALRDAVDAATLRSLGAAFEKAREALVAEFAAVPSGTAKTSRAARKPTNAGRNAAAGRKRTSGKPAADATRDELYDLARKADIPGRSGMTKQQLADALQQHS